MNFVKKWEKRNTVCPPQIKNFKLGNFVTLERVFKTTYKKNQKNCKCLQTMVCKKACSSKYLELPIVKDMNSDLNMSNISMKHTLIQFAF